MTTSLTNATLTTLKYGGYDGGYKGDGTQAALNNHADQLNPNNKKYQGPTPKGQ